MIRIPTSASTLRFTLLNLTSLHAAHAFMKAPAGWALPPYKELLFGSAGAKLV